ncbi:hypothetical protein PEC301653_15110 [Pectobacterium carotovorum subsp. carotovorum]|nr:hypothetical protein PEC301653_15110 [Pectobacterium carotovorum subsp. carotovorum]
MVPGKQNSRSVTDILITQRDRGSSIALSASNFDKLPSSPRGGSLDAGIDFTKVYG